MRTKRANKPSISPAKQGNSSPPKVRLFPPKAELDADGRRRMEGFAALLAIGLGRILAQEAAVGEPPEAVSDSTAVPEPVQREEATQC